MILDGEELALLVLVNNYGGALDIRGPRISRSFRDMARRLIESGHLCGSVKCLDLTEKGTAALKGGK